MRRSPKTASNGSDIEIRAGLFFYGSTSWTDMGPTSRLHLEFAKRFRGTMDSAIVNYLRREPPGSPEKTEDSAISPKVSDASAIWIERENKSTSRGKKK